MSGQLINVWREERRRDIDAHWREERFDVHIAVLAAFRDWERALEKPVAARETGHEPGGLDELRALDDRVQQVLSGLMIFGPHTLAAAADDVYLEFRQCHDYALDLRDLRAPVKKQRYLGVLLLGLRQQVREALQITAGPDVEVPVRV
ncbi:hypothetical protein AB0K15_27100 [Amycolatopsis sp. NPDC049253]|uniref:hypothetical protein n=1 Tax=Amycolatopsis sp. NPDC049253 TaxID=3155274 RepID=UPI003447D5B1